MSIATDVFPDNTRLTGTYSYPNTGNSGCSCISTVDPLNSLITLRNFLYTFKSAITKFYTVENVIVPIDTKITFKGSMTAQTYCLIMWAKLNLGNIFDPENLEHINALIEIHIACNLNWKSNEMLVFQQTYLTRKNRRRIR